MKLILIQKKLQQKANMSHRKFEHPRHGSLGFLPRKRASRHRGKGISKYSCFKLQFITSFLSFIVLEFVLLIYISMCSDYNSQTLLTCMLCFGLMYKVIPFRFIMLVVSLHAVYLFTLV